MATSMLRRLIPFAMLGILLCLSSVGVRTVYKNTSQSIAMKPLALNPDQPKQRRVGQLEFLKAWELGSGNVDFGGISALLALPGQSVGQRFIGVSDAGTLIGFGLTQNSRIDRPFIAAMPGAFGDDIGFEERDSEALAYDAATRRFWVAYEANHAIRRFTPSFARIDGKKTTAEMKKWGSNSGGEAMVRLADGRFILFSEGMDRAARDSAGISYEAIVFSGDPVEPGTRHFTFGYRPPTGYKATDAALLPDGTLLILTRRLSFPQGFSAKLVALDPARIKKNKTVQGRVIAALAPPLLVDNMEGIAVTQEKGRTIIWMISDNNFNIWQRTILMKFALNRPFQAHKPADAKKPAADHAPGFESL